MKVPIIGSAAVLLFLSPLLFASDRDLPAQPGQLATTRTSLMPDAVTLAPHVSVASVGNGADDLHERTMNRFWAASVAAAVTATTLDAATSWGKLESNSILASKSGTFGAKGTEIKAALAAALVIPQICLRKHKELRNAFILGNLGEAGLFSAAAVHNLSIPRANSN
jgi:hypothetical protein